MRTIQASQGSAIHRLESHAQAARTVKAMRDAGVDCMLLKGISHELWLYPDGGRPVSRDVDLLVAPGYFGVASAVMEKLGMRPDRDPLTPRRNDFQLGFVHVARRGVPVELHTSFHFLPAPPERCWPVLHAESESIEIGGVKIDVPPVPARALLLALHVAGHGHIGAWAIEDLRRAIALLSPESWRRAARLGEELGASDALAGGLRVLPAGAEVADALGLPGPSDPELLLSLRSARPEAFRMAGYAGGSSVIAFARLLRSEVIPPPERMRAWYPLARRGRCGLALAHGLRIKRLAAETPKLLADWRQAREARRRW